MECKIPAAFAAAALLLAPVAASAATEMFTVTSAAPFADNDLTISTFDTNLGTLTGVTLDFSASASIFAQILNFGAPGAAFTSASTTTTASLVGPGGVSPIVVNFGEADYGAGVLVFSGVNDLAAQTVTGETSVEATHLAPFAVAGPSANLFTFSLGPNFTSSLTPGAGAVEAVGGNGVLSSATLKVIYTYTPTAVPEPATWAMMVLGFGGLGGALRMRRKMAPAAA